MRFCCYYLYLFTVNVISLSAEYSVCNKSTHNICLGIVIR
ncbi:hypothetical protein GLYMA_20G066776v4 [Glycine max]|nr:hypothetical protein GLYMA_20G066776v4 [Glycine max]KAH1034889.1 hypothetical protein GYH30_055038 [Glycine max]